MIELLNISYALGIILLIITVVANKINKLEDSETNVTTNTTENQTEISDTTENPTEISDTTESNISLSEITEQNPTTEEKSEIESESINPKLSKILSSVTKSESEEIDQKLSKILSSISKPIINEIPIETDTKTDTITVKSEETLSTFKPHPLPNKLPTHWGQSKPKSKKSIHQILTKPKSVPVIQFSHPPSVGSFVSQFDQNESRKNDINDRIHKIRRQLNLLSSIKENDNIESSKQIPHHKSLNVTHYDQFNSDHSSINPESTDHDEQNADKWDLPATSKKSDILTTDNNQECGDFIIEGDLKSFRNKVIEKANIIVSCCNKKLTECDKDKEQLQQAFEQYNNKNKQLKNKLEQCQESLNKCEFDKKKIMIKAKKYEDELKNLIDKYDKLKQIYKEKVNQLRKLGGLDGSLLKEVNKLKQVLEKYHNEREKLNKEVQQLNKLLELCKKEKIELTNIFNKLKNKIINGENNKKELEILIKDLDIETTKLRKKIGLLKTQNNKLQRDDIDLKNQLGHVLQTLKILCLKYRALRDRE